MLPIILGVVGISLSGVIAPGPMFAVTLAKSYRSPWAGTQMALGHAVVEVPLILAIYFGLARFFQLAAVQIALSLAGGGMIIWLGWGLLRSRQQIINEGRDMPANAFAAGIVMSGLNPFFLVWWATVGSLLIMRFLDYGALGLGVFIIVHWGCDLVWLSFVSVLVYRTRTLWGPRIQEWIFIALGLALGGFGVWFVYSGAQIILGLKGAGT